MSMGTSVFNLEINSGGALRNMHDVVDITNKLILWANGLLPAFQVRAASARPGSSENSGSSGDTVLVRIASIETLNSPRSHEGVTSRLKLGYRFDVVAAEPLNEQQALADLAFGLIERDDCADERIQSDGSAVAATFVVERTSPLPRAKPVREAIFDLRSNVQVHGRVESEGRTPLPKATLHVHGSGQLVIADNHGGFAFNAPHGAVLRATVKAKGKAAEVELQPEQLNVITLAMES